MLYKNAEYQGWTNYETWAVALWLDNERSTYDMAMELASEPKEAYQLGDELKDMLEQSMPDLGATIWADLLNGAWSEVNWREIGEHYQQKTAESSKRSKIKKDAFLIRDPDIELQIGNKVILARSVMSKEGNILPQGTELEITGMEGERFIVANKEGKWTICRFDSPKFDKVASQVKDSPANKKDNITLPEGKETAGDKPSEAVDGSTLPADKKEVGDKADRAEEKNSYDKGEDVEDIEAVNKKAHTGTDHVAEMCPVCGGEGRDLGTSERDHYSCTGCGVNFGHKQGSCGHCGSIASHASKEEVIKIMKKAEVESPWVVVQKDGQDMIARRETSELIKESEEDKLEEIKK